MIRTILYSICCFVGLANVSAQPFELPKLPYAYNALEPHVDAQTMEIHYSKHHQAYVNNLNKAIKGTKAENLSIELLCMTAGRRSDAVRNNAGGHYNHTLFWSILSPNPDQSPDGDMLAAINRSFTSLDSLKTLMNNAASTRFGSGWAWLYLTPQKTLAVCSTPNQDNPLMDVSKERGIPILGIDVWEHAYYLKYQNKRGDYLKGIWAVIDWDAVAANYSKAMTSPLLVDIELDSWAALKDFHMVMAQTFHPAEENNLTPIKERSAEFLTKAKALKTSPIPASFNTPQVLGAIDNLIKGAESLNKMVRKGKKDEQLKAKLTELHDLFHTVQKMCNHD